MREARVSFGCGGALNRLKVAAAVAFWVHLAAGVSMALIMRHGLETNLNFANRLSFLVNHRALWTVGWLTWTAAAIAILVFYAAFSAAHHTGRVAVYFTVIAIAADFSAQMIEIAILPGLAQRVIAQHAPAEVFVAVHRAAVMLSGFMANTLYSLSAWILAWTTRHAYARWIWGAGVLTGYAGLALSIAAFANSAAGMMWTNVVLVPCLLLWLAGVALTT